MNNNAEETHPEFIKNKNSKSLFENKDLVYLLDLTIRKYRGNRKIIERVHDQFLESIKSGRFPVSQQEAVKAFAPISARVLGFLFEPFVIRIIKWYWRYLNTINGPVIPSDEIASLLKTEDGDSQIVFSLRRN